MKPPTSLAGGVLKAALGEIAARVQSLPSNGPDRHWNWKTTLASGHSYLVRLENPLAVKQRGTRLEDEANIVRFFASHKLAPLLVAHGTFRGKPFMVEEWVTGRTLPSSGSISTADLRRVVRFLRAVNEVPVTRAARRFLNWKEDFLDVKKRRATVLERLKAGRTIPEFRNPITEIEPILEEGFIELQKLVKRLPRGLLHTPRFVYRDISSHNLFITGSRCIAVDWEWHSVGLADPSFSIVVLMRRFHLSPARRALVLREYQHYVRIPDLEALVRARELERVLGEATWPFGWVARLMKLPLPGKEQQKRGALRTMRKSIAELKRILAA